MNIYERERLRLRDELDAAISQLDLMRDDIKDVEYWKRLQVINKDYAKRIKSIDEAERTEQALIRKEESPSIKHDRREQTYVDILGQLKAEKMNQLISKLILKGARKEDIDINDPFYLDKTAPLEVFERWWDEEMIRLPSVDEVRDFLRRVDINSRGYITYDSGETPKYNRMAYVPLESENSDMAVIKRNIFKNRNEIRKERENAMLQKAKKKTPLLVAMNKDDYLKRRKAANKIQRNADIISALSDVVYAYNLPPYLEDLLIQHIEQVCIHKGITKVDQYRPMLEQFLRNIKEPSKRIKIVEQAIDKDWRVLSDGKF